MVPSPRRPTMLVRWMWIALGVVCVGFGGIGAVVPGLPTTGFMVAAAACFARSSPRLEAWLLRLPGVGSLVADYRAGLGMPRRSKRVASSMIVGACALSATQVGRWWVAAAITVVGLVGIGWIRWRVPLKEQVLAERALASTAGDP